jgi:hypothetical protein
MMSERSVNLPTPLAPFLIKTLKVYSAKQEFLFVEDATNGFPFDGMETFTVA